MQSGTGARGPAPRVLVCDDTEPIRRLLRINLAIDRREGHAAEAELADVEAVAEVYRWSSHECAPFVGGS